MEDKTQKEMVQSLYQAVAGMDGNPEENGLIGDIKEVKDMIKEQNGRQQKTERKVNILIGALSSMGILAGGGFGIAQLIGG